MVVGPVYPVMLLAFAGVVAGVDPAAAPFSFVADRSPSDSFLAGKFEETVSGKVSERRSDEVRETASTNRRRRRRGLQRRIC